YIQRAATLSNPTNAVGGSFILSLHPEGRDPLESHQRSWWIVHTQPTSRGPRPSRIPPTQLVDRSYSAYIQRAATLANPTNGVGGSFILSLHPEGRDPRESHQRSWWIVHTQPTSRGPRPSRIPPTQLVD